MHAILDLPEVRARVSLLSVQDYHRLAEFNESGRRTELVRGVVIEKMSKSPLHSAISRRLYELALASVTVGWEVRKEEPLTFLDSEPEPDLAIVQRASLVQFDRAHPQSAALVVEVAVSSPRLDRLNAALYAENGVAEYWIVLGAEQRIEVYRQPEGNAYRTVTTHGLGDEIDCLAVPGLKVAVSALFPSG